MKARVPKHKVEEEKYSYDKTRQVLEIEFKAINNVLNAMCCPTQESVTKAANEAFPQTIGKELVNTFPLIEANKKTFNGTIYIRETSERILIAVKPIYLK
jgi:hypothetical protein